MDGGSDGLSGTNLRHRKTTDAEAATNLPMETNEPPPRGSPKFRGLPYSESVENFSNETSLRNGKILHQAIWEELVGEMRIKLSTQFDEQLDQAVTELVERAKQREHCLHGFQWHSDYTMNKDSTSNKDTSKLLPTKVFCHRKSVLTELFELSHIRTVYHMFIAILVLFSVNVICHDLFGVHKDTHIYHVDFFQFTFGGLREVVLFWMKMFAATLFIPFVGFLLWCTRRSPARVETTVFDWLMLSCYGIYQILFLLFPVRFILHNQLPPASTAIVATEQIRMLMKSHAFIRTSVERFFEIHSEESMSSPQAAPGTTKLKRGDAEHTWSPDFSHYLYFLFAPTLVFRESYPRTATIRWGYVLSNLLQVCGCVLLSYHVLVRFCFNEFAQFGRSADYTLGKFLLTSTATSVPGGLVMLLIFFAALHSWMNAFAEMLRFGDRLFYKDWWNSTTFSVWYRTWNIVVHDWLYTYIYKDMQLINRSPRARGIAMATVFWLSAAVHEYILSLTFRFFYPVLFVFFTFAGYPFVHIKGKGRGWNVLIWVVLFTGWGQLMCLYSMEWYARKNCLPVFNSWIDFAVPHSWFCRSIPVKR